MLHLKKKLTNAAKAELTETLKVTWPKLSDIPVCDFCGDSAPIFVYAARRMSTGELRACWRWCACEPCSKAIDFGKWNLLNARVTDRLRKMLPEGASDRLLSVAVSMALKEFHDWAVVIPREEGV